LVPTWLTWCAYVALALGILSAIVIVIDLLAGHPQRMAVMNVVWPIAGLYFGPFAVWAYWRFARHTEPQQRTRKKGKRQPKKPFWQTVFVSTSHCGAGCTIGDTMGETYVFLSGLIILGSSLLTVYVVDFLLAYIVGIVFQFFAIAPMRHLGFADGLKAAVQADTLSLMAFEVGMFGWMALTRLVFFHPALEANNPVFWFMMQIAMIVGFMTSYPANWLLVKKGIKEAM
jgi:hypothetical protein